MKLIVAAHKAADILETLKLAKQQRLNIVLSGAEEGWMVASDIARARVPVMLNPTNNLPASFETRGATMENAARLHAAGVTIAFANGDGAPAPARSPATTPATLSPTACPTARRSPP